MSRSKELEFTIEVETEISCSILPACKGIPQSMEGPGTPDEPAEIEDLYIGVIIGGTSIDITHLLNKMQLACVEDECFNQAGDDNDED